MKARLGVNIDHVATLRQQRGENYPDLALAGRIALEAGADQITIHLREDRRHIQDADVAKILKVCREFNRPLNLEMGASPEILEIAMIHQPEWICLVPEKREERTTEGGLDLSSAEGFTRLNKTIETIRKKSKTKVSLFIEADEKIAEAVKKLQVDAVEIHTGEFAIAFNQKKSIDCYLKKFSNFHQSMKKLGIGYHAGHGLTDLSVVPLVKQGLFEEYNIGHWIICDSVFNGLFGSIKKLQLEINKGHV